MSLEHVLWVLVPHVVAPLSLNGFLEADDLNAVVLESLAAMSIVELDELLHDLCILHVSEGLVLDVSVDIG